MPILVFSRVLTYSDAINIALNQSYTIKSFEQNKLAMESAYQYRKAEFKPRLDAGIYTPAWNEIVTPIQQVDGLPVYNSIGSIKYSGDMAFTYMLPTGGNFALSAELYRDNLSTTLATQNYRTLATNKAYTRLAFSFNQPVFTANEKKENLDEAKYYFDRFSNQFKRGQMDIIYEVTQGFYQLYRATREVEIAEEKLKNAEEAARIARIKAENGRIPEVDVLITQVDLARSQAIVSESRNAFEREKDSFKHLVGLSLDEDIQIVTDLKYDTFVVNLDRAIESALAHRLELDEAELNIELQKIEVKRAKRFSELKGNISAYYDVTGVSTIPSGDSRELFQSSFDNFVDRRPNRGVTFSISYPIFDWGRGAALEQRAQAYMRDYELELEDTKKLIIRQVRDVVRSLEEAKKRLKIHEQNQQVAQMTYEISRKRFENGDINSQQLALEQERLADSQLSYLDAFITYQLQVADLKRKTLWDFEGKRSYLQEIAGADQTQ
ncbi:TolC family protein [candidate division KSB1 bacterium]|nr:TolC family protein [candidate division KSB1 bacterium]